MDTLKSLSTAVHRATNKSNKNGNNYLGLSTLAEIFEAHGIEVESAATQIGKAAAGKSKRAKVVAEATAKVMTKLVSEDVDLEAPETKKFMKLLTERLFAAATLNDLRLENATLKQIVTAKDALIQGLREDIDSLQEKLTQANIKSVVTPRMEVALNYKFVENTNPFKTCVAEDLNMPELCQDVKAGFDQKVYNNIKASGKTGQKTITSKKFLNTITPALEKITIKPQ